MLRVYLKPQSAFPAYISSITLSGAICYALAELFGRERVTEYLSKPPFLLSSAFPYIENGNKKEHLMPKPIAPVRPVVSEPKGGKGRSEDVKKYKKVSLLHESLFWKRVRGEIGEGEMIEALEGGYEIKGSAIVPKGLDFSIISTELPGNIINRLTGKAENFFYRPRSFHSSGLYFLADLRMNRNEFLAALDFLSERGFSDDVSTGNGWFEHSEEDIKWDPGNGEYLTTLSMYIPAEDELKNFEGYYDLIKVRGRSADGRVKRPVYAMKEGSVFRNTGKDVYGRMERVLSDAVDFGYAFTVGVRNVEA